LCCYPAMLSRTMLAHKGRRTRAGIHSYLPKVEGSRKARGGWLPVWPIFR
jgi:hypothetical protein